MSSAGHELEAIEIQLLVEGIYRHYGFDFRNYAYASLRRRIWNAVRAESLTSISGLQEQVLHDPAAMERLLLAISVSVTSMFRDPKFYLTFRQKAIPLLRTYPFIRIWHAGCSTGEEVYSIAILLHEEGLYDRCRIYATDMNELVLRRARAGIIPMASMQEFTVNYQRAGGKESFSEFYTASHDNAILRSWLQSNIVFAQHNLVTDGPFNEFNVILCRNVMIYFNRELQERVHQLIYGSLERFGFLGLGNKESIKLTPHEAQYQQLDLGEKLYRKVS